MLSTKHSNDNSGIQIAQVESKAEEPKSSFEAAVKTDEETALLIRYEKTGSWAGSIISNNSIPGQRTSTKRILHQKEMFAFVFIGL